MVAHPVVGPELLKELAGLLPEGQGEQLAEDPDRLRIVYDVPMKRIVSMAFGPALDEALHRLMERTRTAGQ
ncbi:hypothetical protein [Streptomyces chartreusis]|uniref:hypothetical protein n=1 Tax=Streptomyces chartreusis TaxID=1969 RepID=UPI0036335223